MFKRKRRRAMDVHSMDELKDLAESGQPILIDFFQFGCAPCQVMDGIVDEIANEYADAAHVVKINVGRVPWAVEEFKIRSTPTFVVLAPPRAKGAKPGTLTQRWRGSGLVKKEALSKILDSAGARPAQTG